MVEHRVLTWVCSSLARRCLGLAVAILCGLSVAFAQSPQEKPGLSLRLDWDLMPEVGTPGISRDQLLDAEAPELRQRILKVQDQAASLEKENAEKSAYLNEHEALIRRMRGAVAAQEEVIARLAADANRPEPTVVAQGAAAAPRLAPPPRPAVSTLAPPIHLGPIELPGILRNYLTEGALAAVLLILLGWALYLRSVAKARAAELTMLRAGSSARPTPVADGPGLAEEWLEPEPIAGRGPGPDAASGPQPKKSVESPSPKRTDADTAPELDWSDTIVRKKAADSDALAEVDTLIAGGNLRKAKQLLDKLAKDDALNPEFRLRLLHVDSALGNRARESEQEQILAKMSQGALSDTRNRIKEIGRGLLPGHPLFDDDAKLEEAKRIISAHEREGAEPAATEQPGADQETPAAAPARRPQAPPLVLDLEVDQETVDFLSDINFDIEDEAGKKG